jgi:hypothetical protein
MKTNFKFIFSIFVAFIYLFIATATDDTDSEVDCLNSDEFVGEYRAPSGLVDKFEVKLFMYSNMNFIIKFIHSQDFPDIEGNILPQDIYGTWKVICDDKRNEIEFGEVVKTYDLKYLLFFYESVDDGEPQFFKVSFGGLPELFITGYGGDNVNKWTYKVVNDRGNGGKSSYLDGVPDRYWNGHLPFSPIFYGKTFTKYSDEVSYKYKVNKRVGLINDTKTNLSNDKDYSDDEETAIEETAIDEIEEFSYYNENNSYKESEFINSEPISYIKINDPDGYTNVRSGKSSSTDIIHQIFDENQLFKLIDDSENWWKIEIDDGGNEAKTGFIYYTKVLKVESFTIAEEKAYFHLKPNEDYQNRAYVIKGDILLCQSNIENGFRNCTYVNSKGDTTNGYVIANQLQ